MGEVPRVSKILHHVSSIARIQKRRERERERERECVCVCVHPCVTALHQLVYLLDSIMSDIIYIYIYILYIYIYNIYIYMIKSAAW